MESHSRSVAKALTWRCIASFTTAIIVYFATGTWALALTGGIADAIIKLTLYYGHERAWNVVRWGKPAVE